MSPERMTHREGSCIQTNCLKKPHLGCQRTLLPCRATARTLRDAVPRSLVQSEAATQRFRGAPVAFNISFIAHL